MTGTRASGVMKASPAARLRCRADKAWRLFSLVRQEWRSPVRLPLSIRWRCWRRGFLSLSHVMYNTAENGWDLYLGDAARYLRTPSINGRWGMLVHDKLLFSLLLESVQPGITPEWLGVIARGTFHPSPAGARNEPFSELAATPLVLKPLNSGGGENVYVVARAGDRWRVNQQELPEPEFAAFQRKLDAYLVTRCVEQADYARAIFPGSANTIRFLTMWVEDARAPFLAAAVLRFGTRHTAPTDNWSGGGLSARIDLDTGIVSRAAAHPDSSVLQWHDRHPDTGAEIAGIQVPGWKELKTSMLELSSRLAMFPYLGWDVVVTNAGMKILEANHYPGLTMIQVHAPLLADPRVRRFYERNGVL